MKRLTGTFSIFLFLFIYSFLYSAAKVGCGHHWTFAYGDLRSKLKDIASLLDIEIVDLEQEGK